MSAIIDLYDNAGLTYEGFIHVAENLYISPEIYPSYMIDSDYDSLPTREDAELIADNLERIFDIRKMLGLPELDIKSAVWVNDHRDRHFLGTVDLRDKSFDMEPNFYLRLKMSTKRKPL